MTEVATSVAWNVLPRLRATYVQDILCSEISRKNHPLMAGCLPG